MTGCALAAGIICLAVGILRTAQASGALDFGGFAIVAGAAVIAWALRRMIREEVGRS